MTTAPLVSIITPFLNAEPYFEEAIESVIAQTYPHWELLLVDDGSSDRSTAVAQEYASQYPGQIRYLEHEHHRNRGKSTSRNLGIAHAKGDYIALLDADDVYLPQKLEKQVATLQNHPEAAMIYGPTLYWHSWTGAPSDRDKDYVASLGIAANRVVPPPQLLTLYLNDSGVVPCTCALLVKRQLLEKIGGFDETIQHMYEDQVFIAKICFHAPVFVEEYCWDKYRQHEDSTSFVAIRTGEYHPLKLNPSRQAYLKWLGQYLTDHGTTDAALWKAYKKAAWLYENPQLAPIVMPVSAVISRMRGMVREAFS